LSKDSPNRIGQSFICQHKHEKKKRKKGEIVPHPLPTKAKPYTSFIYAQQRIISLKKKPFVSNKRGNSRELCVDRRGSKTRESMCTRITQSKDRERSQVVMDSTGGFAAESTDEAQRISTCPNPPLFLSFSASRRFPWREVIFQLNRELLKLLKKQAKEITQK
jgi:hypothetical protein